MKVVILHQHFRTPYEGGAIRSYYLATALRNAGREVIVVTAHNGGRYRKAEVDGVEVHYLPVPYKNEFGFVRRGWSFLQFIVRSVRHFRTLPNVDLCYAISVPITIGIAALRIKRRLGIPFLFEVGDLWPDAPIQLGFIRNPFLRSMLYRLERSVYQEAEAIVALSLPIKEAIEKKVPGKTVHLIPNMSDTGFFSPEAKEPALEARLGVSGKFVISYIGAIGFANGLDHLLACARAALFMQDVHFLIAGDGALLPRVREQAKKDKLRNVTILPFTSRDGVREILNVTDAVFISFLPFPILETGSPNKYFDALAAGKVVITNFGGWVTREVERENCGVGIGRSTDRFIEGLRQLTSDNASVKTMQHNARALAEKKYSRRWLGDAFVRIVENIKARNSEGR